MDRGLLRSFPITNSVIYSLFKGFPLKHSKLFYFSTLLGLFACATAFGQAPDTVTLSGGQVTIVGTDQNDRAVTRDSGSELTEKCT